MTRVAYATPLLLVVTLMCAARSPPGKPLISIAFQSSGSPDGIVPLTPPAVASEGVNTTFTADVPGSRPLTFQWFFNGAIINGATNASYVLQTLNRADEGSYSVVVTNTAGRAVSDPARLLVSNVKPTSYMSLLVSAPTGGVLQIQFADSLAPDALWRPFTGVTSSVAPLVVIDPGITNVRQRFYKTPLAQGLTGRLFPGWNYSDLIGSVHAIEFIDPQSGATNWRTLQILALPTLPYPFVDTTATNGAPRHYRTTLLESSCGPLANPAVVPVTNMVYITSGSFTMGSPESEPVRNPWEGPQTRVTISCGFYMGRYEVTQREYVAVIGSNPSYFTGNLDLPVEEVTWPEAVAYCVGLTTRERNAGRLPVGYVYRLPTEAEWEYACRAGTTTPFHYGTALRSGMANFYATCEYPPCAGDSFCCNNPSGTYLERTIVVGSYAPNAWGLYDMHGDVWEWCSDFYSTSLPGGSVTDPQGPATGSRRVIRGGSWYNYPSYCRSAYRYEGFPTGRSTLQGFRVVLAKSQP